MPIITLVFFGLLSVLSVDGDLRKTALKSTTPDDEIVRLDINNDSRPDILERWWNGKRVRWLDENGDMLPTDTRGDQVGDVMQIDKNGDGIYDSVLDINIKWADNDGDGRADVQAFATQAREWSNGNWNPANSHWMIFIDVEKDGVLGWLDWTKFDFDNDNWGYTGLTDWLPDYNGDAVFLKVHRPPQSLTDPRLNWENPFAFYDFDNDGVSEMAIRWLDPVPPLDKDVTNLTGVLNEAFATFDVDNDSTKGNETDYDLSLRGAGGPGLPYRQFVHKYPALKGNPKFDACFQWNNWRRIDELMYMPHEKSFDSFFTARWGRCISCLTRTTTIIAGNAWRCITRCTASAVRKRSISTRRRSGGAATTPNSRWPRQANVPESPAIRRLIHSATAVSLTKTIPAAANSTSAFSIASCTSPERSGARGPSTRTASFTAATRRLRRGRSRRALKKS